MLNGTCPSLGGAARMWKSKQNLVIFLKILTAPDKTKEKIKATQEPPTKQTM